MDFQNFADSFFSPTCITSVEKTADGGYGEIRIVAANAKYIDMVSRRGMKFVPGSLYTDFFPQNQSFEDVCYSAAIEKRDVHTYAHISNVDVWFDIYGMPIDYNEGNTYYCSYTSTPNDNAYALLDSVGTSETSTDVLKTCIRLHKANNLKEAMESVISEIRRICKAEGCTVLLINNDEEEYSILATNFVEESKIKRVTEFEGFYDIANSWKDMLGDEGDCIIIRNDEEMDPDIRRENYLAEVFQNVSYTQAIFAVLNLDLNITTGKLSQIPINTTLTGTFFPESRGYDISLDVRLHL